MPARTVRLPARLTAALERVARELGVSPDGLALELLTVGLAAYEAEPEPEQPPAPIETAPEFDVVWCGSSGRSPADLVGS